MALILVLQYGTYISHFWEDPLPRLVWAVVLPLPFSFWKPFSAAVSRVWPRESLATIGLFFANRHSWRKILTAQPSSVKPGWNMRSWGPFSIDPNGRRTNTHKFSHAANWLHYYRPHQRPSRMSLSFTNTEETWEGSGTSSTHSKWAGQWKNGSIILRPGWPLKLATTTPDARIRWGTSLLEKYKAHP